MSSTQSSIITSLGLPQNHTDILLVLTTKDSTASDLLQKTSVSNGRIYRILAELVDLKLISKVANPTSGKAVYTIKPFATHIQNYLQYDFQLHSQKTSSIIKSLDSLGDTNMVEVIHGSKADFDHHIEDFLYQSTSVKILHKHTSLPWFLYCFDQGLFFKVRTTISKSRPTGSSSLKAELLLKRQAYLDTYTSKPVEHVMSHQAWEDYKKTLDPKNLSRLKLELKNHPQVKIYLIDKLHNPFSTYVSDKTVLQPLFFLSHTDRLLVLRGKDIVATYQDYFAKYLEDSTRLERFI